MLLTVFYRFYSELFKDHLGTLKTYRLNVWALCIFFFFQRAIQYARNEHFSGCQIFDFFKLLRVCFYKNVQISIAVGNSLRARTNYVILLTVSASHLKFSCWTDENRYGTVNKLCSAAASV